jgi:hypothetical protein
MAQYVTLEPTFVGVSTGNETITSVIVVIIFFVVASLYVRAAWKRMNSDDLSGKDKEEK